MMNYMCLVLCAAVLGPLHFPPSLGAAPLSRSIQYQGRLLDGPSPANGQYDFRVRLFDAAGGGLQVGPTLTNGGVTVAGGVVQLELNFGIGPEVFAQATWLELAVRSTQVSPVAFTPLAPRQQVLPAPASFYALQAGAAAAVAVDAVDSAGLRDGSVTSDKLAFNSVNTAHLNSNAVTAAKIADASVGAAKIQDGAVNALKLAENAVTSFKLADGAVSTAKLAAGAVNSNALGDGAVILAKLSTNGALSGQSLAFNGTGVIWRTSVGDVTAVLAGSGLAGGGSNGAVTLSAVFGGNGATNASARADHQHNALYAALAHTHSGADVVSGTVAAARIDPLIARTNQILPMVLASDGPGSGLDADLLDGLHAAAFAPAAHTHDTNYWKLTGNSGTPPPGQFLGTRDNQPLELRVNTLRALRLEPAITPNVIGGAESNSVSSGALGAAVAGGGSAVLPNRVTDDHGTVAGGAANQAGDNAGSTADRPYATVGGGLRNLSAADRATVAGGAQNTNRSSSGAIGGGQLNLIGTNASGGVIAGGTQNTLLAAGAAIGGGLFNTNSGAQATIAGGRNNSTGNSAAVIGGGSDNFVSGVNATIAGGSLNQNRGDAATVGGGTANRIDVSASNAGIAGGAENQVAPSSTHAAVGGGFRNRIAAGFTVIAGGNQNTNGAQGGAIGGGTQNALFGVNAVIGGGTLNRNAGLAAVIAGGDSNSTTNDGTAIGGGRFNAALAIYASVGGGHDNLNQGESAALSGGEANVIGAQARAGALAGGANNRIQPLATHATIAGGRLNTNAGVYAAIGGGLQNSSAGVAATVPGGQQNSAGADYAFAAGRRAKANHAGAFVWGDATDADVLSTATNQFVVRATGGVKLYSNEATNSGVELAPGSGAWSSISDRDAKENFQVVDPGEILARLVATPIQTWNYKTQDPSIRHVGPTAQDFHAAFGVGESDRRISTIDVDGVALAAIQGLHRVVDEQARELRRRERQMQAMEKRLAELEAAMQAVREHQQATRP